MALGVYFPERMTGWLCFDEVVASLEARVAYPVDLRLHVVSDAPLRPGQPRAVSGQALFPGFPPALWAADLAGAAPVTGTMVIHLRGVRYSLWIDVRGLGPIELRGEKRYQVHARRWAATRETFTTLDLDVRREARHVGRGQIVYRGSIPGFLAGFRPVRTAPGAPYDPHRALALRLARVLPAFLPSYERFTDREGLIERLRLEAVGQPATTLLALSLEARALRALVGLRSGRSSGADGARERAIAAWVGRRRGLRTFTLPLSSFLLSAAFGDRGFAARAGQNAVEPAKVSEVEPWMAAHCAPRSADPGAVEELEADVIIVGSGAGGAAAASALAREGLAVAVIEEGPYFKRPDLTGERLVMLKRLYRRQGLQFALGNSPLWVPTGRAVGGTTVINCGTCMRTPPAVLARWAQELGLRDLGLEAHFDEVERMLDVKPVPLELQGGVRGVLERGVRGAACAVEPLSRGETGCDGQSVCIFGCPTGAKRSTDVSFMPAAMRHGAQLFSGRRVDQLLMEGDRVVGVEAGPEGLGDQFRLRIRARAVVLAAGALMTPGLLRRHGLHRRLPQIGRNLTVHPALNVCARFRETVRETRFVSQSLSVRGLETRGFLLEGHTLLADSIPLTVLLDGGALAEAMEHVEQITNFAAMLTDQTTGRLLFPPGLDPIPWYWVSQRTADVLRDAAALLAEIFLRAGAEAVYLPVDGFEQVSTPVEVARLRATRVPGSRFRLLSAHHPMGTCRMGSSPADSVISSRGQVWGTEGLYVADASAIPGPLGVNPQVTIMANALRISAGLATILR